MVGSVESSHPMSSDLPPDSRDHSESPSVLLDHSQQASGLPLSGILHPSRHLARTQWFQNQNPKHITFPAHGRTVVTCLLFSHGRIISASDDHSIHVYSPHTGQLIHSLNGHNGGVWSIAATKDTLVSGSTDGTLRIWDLSNGRCTHIFGGHTSTVRCVAIVQPEIIDVEENGVITREKWPKQPLIVSGSRDHSLRVWALPLPDDNDSLSKDANDIEGVLSEVATRFEHYEMHASNTSIDRRTRTPICITSFT